MDINERIKEAVAHIQNARSAAGFNQTQAAQHLGKKQPSISNWEKGEHLPSLRDIIIMCELFGATPSKLLNGADDGDVSPSATPRIIGSCLSSSSGKIFKITKEEEDYLMGCLLEAREGQRNPDVLESKGKKATTA